MKLLLVILICLLGGCAEPLRNKVINKHMIISDNTGKIEYQIETENQYGVRNKIVVPGKEYVQYNTNEIYRR